MAWVGKHRREMWGGDEADISLAGMQKFRLEWIWIRGAARNGMLMSGDGI
jgi:hypothetical protein